MHRRREQHQYVKPRFFACRWRMRDRIDRVRWSVHRLSRIGSVCFAGASWVGASRPRHRCGPDCCSSRCRRLVTPLRLGCCCGDTQRICGLRYLPPFETGPTFLSPAAGAQWNLRSPVPTARRSTCLTASPWATICQPYRAFLRHRPRDVGKAKHERRGLTFPYLALRRTFANSSSVASKRYSPRAQRSMMASRIGQQV